MKYLLLALSILAFSFYSRAQTNEQFKEQKKMSDLIKETIINSGDWENIKQVFLNQDSYDDFLQKMKSLNTKLKLYQKDKNHYYFLNYKAPFLLQTYLYEDAKDHLSFLFQLKFQFKLVGDKSLIEKTTIIPVDKIENKSEMLQKLSYDSNGYDTTNGDKPEPPKPE